MVEFPYHVSRYAFSPAGRARAMALWRAGQEAAVLGADALGWPIERFRDQGSFFVVHSMTMQHHRELQFGEQVTLRTWISSFSRAMVTTREVQMWVGEELVAACSQRWVHVSKDLVMVRAEPTMLADFAPEAGPPSVRFPRYQKADVEQQTTWELACGHRHMDPLGHVNHPTYVGWADEAVSRVVFEAGRDPHQVHPVWEWLKFSQPIVAPVQVQLRVRLVGMCGGDAVIEVGFVCEGRTCAQARLIRRLVGWGPREWEKALMSSGGA